MQFIDFGNTDNVSGNSGDLKRLPESLLQYEPQAKEASLAYLKVPRLGGETGQQAATLVQNAALDKVTEAIVVEQSGNRVEVVLFKDKGEKDWNKSVNCQLLERGLAAMAVGEDDCPEEAVEWFDYEAEAREEQLGLWEFGGVNDEDDQ